MNREKELKLFQKQPEEKTRESDVKHRSASIWVKPDPWLGASCSVDER